ncbi:MAG: hypothetical protein AAF515_18590 [Pseudomonadota bacterium]
MKQTITAALLAGLIALSSNAFASADRAAVAVVDSYMTALVDGNLRAMKRQLSKRMKKERKRVLANTQYANTLQRAYTGASYEVISSEQVSATRAVVTVRITLESSDKVHVRFTLDGGPNDYTITSEA